MDVFVLVVVVVVTTFDYIYQPKVKNLSVYLFKLVVTMYLKKLRSHIYNRYDLTKTFYKFFHLITIIGAKEYFHKCKVSLFDL